MPSSWLSQRTNAAARAGLWLCSSTDCVLPPFSAVAGRLGPDGAGAALARVARTGELLESNVAPELALDVLVLAWPRLAGADAA